MVRLKQKPPDAHDRPTIFEPSWPRPASTTAVVALVHGFTEHSGRYEHVARALAARGLAVRAMDLRGHGRSGGPRVWIERFSEHLDDVDRWVARVRQENPGVRLFVLGHSMGGTVAALLAIDRRIEVDGLILSAPAVKVGDEVFPILCRVASLVSRVWPTLRIVRMGCSRLSRDPANVERFRLDPLVFHGPFPVRTGAEILSAANRARREAGAIRQPLLVLQGTADSTVSPAGSRDLYDRAASTDKTLKLYEGLYHDLFGEPEKEQVIGDLIEWIVARCEGANETTNRSRP